MAMRVKKLMVKLFDEDDGKVKWLHVCYIGSKLYDTFLEEKHIDTEKYAEAAAALERELARLKVARKRGRGRTAPSIRVEE